MESNHNIIIEGRNKISITGVETTTEFDETSITCVTVKGTLVIKGDNLHVEKLDLQNHELWITGLIYNLEYIDTKQTGNFLAKLFK